MGILDTMITDRTEADVLRARRLARKGLEGMTEAEKAEWLAGMKGRYNAEDLNRISGATEYVHGRLLEAHEDLETLRGEKDVAWDPLLDFPYDPAALEIHPKTDFQRGEMPTAAEGERILADLRTIRDALPLPEETPTLPDSLRRLTAGGANRMEYLPGAVERALETEAARLRELVEHTGEGYMFAGEMYAGEQWD